MIKTKNKQKNALFQSTRVFSCRATAERLVNYPVAYLSNKRNLLTRRTVCRSFMEAKTTKPCDPIREATFRYL